MIKNIFFKTKNSLGEIIKYEMLDTVFCGETEKSYIIYTDHSLDENNRPRIFASVYNPKEYEITLRPIETRAEWDYMKEYLEREYARV